MGFPSLSLLRLFLCMLMLGWFNGILVVRYSPVRVIPFKHLTMSMHLK